jgi:hypothetical protein
VLDAPCRDAPALTSVERSGAAPASGCCEPTTLDVGTAPTSPTVTVEAPDQ